MEKSGFQIYHPMLEETDQRLTQNWSFKALAQGRFSNLFMKTYFKRLNIVINPYDLWNELTFMKLFIKDMTQKGNGIAEIGSVLDPYILCFNLFPNRRQNMVPRLACKELVPFVTEPCKFSMGLSSSPVDTYNIESMKDILRQNLWRSEDLDSLYLIYSTCESAGLAEILLLIFYAESNDMYHAITARLIGRSLSRPMVKQFCANTHLKEPLSNYLKLEGIEPNPNPSPTIFSLMPSTVRYVDSDDEVFE